jgi:hypothetical protein
VTLSISLSPEAEAQLKAKAAAAGVDVETFVARQLERLAASRSLLEISGPAHEEFLASGMTDDELGDYLERVKHEMRAERRRRQAS